MHLNVGFFSNSEECPDDLPLRPEKCNFEQFEASFVRTNDALTDERPDGIPRRLDGGKGIELIDLNSAQSVLEARN
jgi:hypothetical protein